MSRRRIFQLGIKAVGGFDSFLKNWVAAVRDLVASRQSSPRLLRLFELLWELQREQDIQCRAALQNTTDADLKSLIDMQLTRMIEQDPELVLHAAQRLGWRLIPPNSSNLGDQAALAGCSSHRAALSRIQRRVSSTDSLCQRDTLQVRSRLFVRNMIAYIDDSLVHVTLSVRSQK